MPITSTVHPIKVNGKELEEKAKTKKSAIKISISTWNMKFYYCAWQIFNQKLIWPWNKWIIKVLLLPHYIFNGRSPYYRSSTSGLCVLQYSKRFLISALRQIFSGFSHSGNFRDQTISKYIKSTVAYFIVVIKLFKSLRVNGIVIVFTEPQASTDSELYLKNVDFFLL